MYTSQRPVPSKAALRFLRQLAYISSGTACGAATLIAEERRRQTCIAKKIVDNTRRLRSHPRYAHAATEVAIKEPDYTLWGPEPEDVDSRTDRYDIHAGDSGRRHRDSASRTSVAPDAASENSTPRNEVLPSRVDKDYQQWTERQVWTPPTLLETPGDAPSTISQAPIIEHNVQAGQDQPRKPYTLQDMPITWKEWKDLGKDDGRLIDVLRFRLQHDLGGGGNHDQAMNRLSLFYAYCHKNRDSYGPATDLFTGTGITVHFTRRTAEASQAEYLIAAVHAFFDLYPVPERHTSAKRSICDFATYLLDKSVLLGRVEEVESICRWLDAHHNLDKSHLVTIVDNLDLLRTMTQAEPETSQARENATFMSEFEDILSSDSLEQSERRSIELFTVIVLLSRTSSDGSSARAHSKLLAEFLRERGSDDIESSLGRVCVLLAQRGKTRAATELFLGSLDRLPQTESMLEFGKELLETCTRAGDDRACKQSILALEKVGLPLWACVNHLAAVGVENESFIKLFVSCLRRSPKKLSPSTYRQAFTTLSSYGRTDLAKSVLSRIPGPLGDDILDGLQTYWHMMLQRQWRETKNLNLVMDTFDNMRRIAGPSSVMVPVYNVMIRLCGMAGQQDEVGRLMKQMETVDELKPDVDTFMSMVLGVAKTGDWDNAHQLLGLLRKDSFESVTPAKRAHYFHPLISLYASDHDSQSLRSFVTKLFDDLDVRLHRATFSIVLKALVRDQEFQQIRGWIEHVQRHGLQIEITDDDVMDAVKTFYYDRQPPSYVLGNLLRRLGYERRHLLSRELLLLSANALGRDIREQVGIATRVRSRTALKEELVALKGHLDRVSEGMPGDDLRAHYTTMRKPPSLPTADKSPVVSNGTQECEAADGKLSPHSFTMSREPSATSDSYNTHSTPDSGLRDLYLSTTSDVKSLYYKKREVRGQMLLDLTLGEPSKAIDFYKNSLSFTGLPESTVSLDVAVEASLAKQHGDETEALSLISAAQQAGMSVRSTLLPLMVNQFKQMRGKDASQLRNIQTVLGKILQFYRTMAAEGIPVSHHVAVTAARTMTRFAFPERAVALLRRVYRIAEQQSAPFDIVAYTVFLEAYMAVDDKRGARWVVQQVLARDIQIDHKFLAAFRTGRRFLEKLADERPKFDRPSESLLPHLRDWQALCRQRRFQQLRETRILGHQLIDALIDCSKPSDSQTTMRFGDLAGRRPVIIREKHMFPKGAWKQSVRMQMQWKRKTFHVTRRERTSRLWLLTRRKKFSRRQTRPLSPRESVEGS